MARYTGPKEKIERRLGEKLLLKGERSHSPKAALTRRPYPPGVHGRRRPGKLSEFAQQLRSKQKVRNTYRLLEKQFKGHIKKSLSQKKDPYPVIVSSLESRLDNVVFRGGFAQSRDQARQLVNHGHILVNGKKVSIPSYAVRIGETISVREQSKRMPYFSSLLPQWIKNYETPDWIDLNRDALTATVKRFPSQEDSGLKTDDLRAIVEYYSR